MSFVRRFGGAPHGLIVSLRCGPPFADRQDQGRFCFAAAVMRSVHKFSYGHKFERTAATPVVA